MDERRWEVDQYGLVIVYLLWSMNTKAVIGLRGIATSQATANLWRKALASEPYPPVKVWIDKTQLDHLYASNLTEIRYGR